MLPHQLFFPSIFSAIEIVSDLLPKKNEVENACHTQSYWIVASLLRHNWDFLCRCLQKHIFCCIPRSNDIDIFFLYHKDASN
jgi:hypothetical protein